ncbi:FtsX-like permease family protein [Arhodomonas sp. AD133]|uniref:FtsX-like permease family protein n=1 Tax=Arhodomonas sp. AD133 TaxID=3415009 RepID=UPI003EB8C9F9
MRWLLLAGRRALYREPMQWMLALVGIALGVAVVVAVDIANRAAQSALNNAVERVAGAATHQVVAGPEGVPEIFYRRLRVALGVDRALPVVSGAVTVRGRRFQLLGVDPFAAQPFMTPLATDTGVELSLRMLTHSETVAVSRETAQRLGVGTGEAFALDGGAGSARVRVAAVFTDRGGAFADVLVADIAVAQALLGRFGRLDRIDLILEPSAAAKVRAALPPGVELLPAGRRRDALAAMTDAFHVNLRALSLLALVVGVFLVFNTMSFLVVRRRGMLASLRALGATRGQIVTQVLADAGMLAVGGTLVGLPAGMVLGAGLTGLVAATVDQLYLTIPEVHTWQPLALAVGGALGLAGPLVAAVPSALEAAGVAPRAGLQRTSLEQRALRSARRMAFAGGAAVVGGTAAVAASEGLTAGFVGLFALILGAALLAPLWVRMLARLAAGGRLGWRLAVRGAGASLSRTGIAVAALAVAVATVIGVATMISSFRGSVVAWLEASLRADFYVSADGALPDGAAATVAALPGVDHVTRSRHVRLPVEDGYLDLRAVALAEEDRAAYPMVTGGDGAWRAFASARAVLVSEPFAARRGLGVGERLSLTTPEGPVNLRVAGIYRDYANVRGTVLMRLALYRRLWRDTRLTGLGVHLAEGADAATLARRIQAHWPARVGVTDNRTVFRRSLAVFDQTFRITGVLRLLAAVVAFVGVLGALMALQLERRREIAVLRALGLTRAGVAVQVFGQSGFLGAAAGVWAMPLGIGLAWLLVTVINRRAFGWTLEFALQPAALAQGVTLAVSAALLAAAWPAWALARREPAGGLQRE